MSDIEPRGGGTGGARPDALTAEQKKLIAAVPGVQAVTDKFVLKDGRLVRASEVVVARLKVVVIAGLRKGTCKCGTRHRDGTLALVEAVRLMSAFGPLGMGVRVAGHHAACPTGAWDVEEALTEEEAAACGLIAPGPVPKAREKEPPRQTHRLDDTVCWEKK
jgi:hypothetical protein